MIGKPEWFTYRILGWGLRPRTWQGWVYVLVFIALFALFSNLPINSTFKLVSFAILFGVFLFDSLHMMFQLNKVHDERENQHQLLIERNCSFAAIAIIVGILLYQGYTNSALLEQNGFPFDVSLFVVLGVMVLTKIVSTIYAKTKL